MLTAPASCSTNEHYRPDEGWPGVSPEASHAAFPLDRQPGQLDCWPRDEHGRVASCDHEIRVLSKKNDLNCLGLDLVDQQGELPGACERSCCDDPFCPFWQVDQEQRCWHGAGLKCTSRLGWGPEWKASGAMRLQRGHVRVLKNLTGYRVLGLTRVFRENEYATEGESLEECRNMCYSNLRCTYWQLGYDGCRLEWTGDQVGFPLTVRNVVFSPEGRDVGEYIQHWCPHKSEVVGAKGQTATLPEEEGFLRKWFVHTGMNVSKGSPVVELEVNGRQHVVRADGPGTIVQQLDLQVGERVSLGEALIVTSPFLVVGAGQHGVYTEHGGHFKRYTVPLGAKFRRGDTLVVLELDGKEEEVKARESGIMLRRSQFKIGDILLPRAVVAVYASEVGAPPPGSGLRRLITASIYAGSSVATLFLCLLCTCVSVRRYRQRREDRAHQYSSLMVAQYKSGFDQTAAVIQKKDPQPQQEVGDASRAPATYMVGGHNMMTMSSHVSPNHNMMGTRHMGGSPFESSLTTVLAASPKVQTAPKMAGASMTDAWKYTSADSFQEMLLSGAVKFLKGTSLIAMFEAGDRIERQQELPEKAFWRPTEALENLRKSGNTIQFFLHAVSYRWLDDDHPDKDRDIIEIVVTCVRLAMEARKTLRFDNPDVAVFWDFACLPQEPRSEDEYRFFKTGLKFSNIIYGHQLSAVWMITDGPETDGFPYDQSGWCHFEASVSALTKGNFSRLDLSRNSCHYFTYQKLAMAARAYRPPPSTPERFSQELAQLFFTMEGDAVAVLKLYTSTFTTAASSTSRMEYSNLNWGPAEASVLAEALPRFRGCEALILFENPLEDEGMEVLAPAACSLPSLKVLNVMGCLIGDRGAGALAALIAKAPALEVLYANDNRMRNAAVEQLRAAWAATGKEIGNLIV
eukprot:CAMPEP_0194523408 /NCGR_PEP_ID=MMETSP0253-20130528/58277_1 /TAXON_ID=2966 /ORGANISM="Noctiluca scintillans" /LENGTH=912 /DNA_ID=CAMNT_0039367945 /DNA_START=225 /DNA_END=2963 /DNA_ORIENTATION=-